MGHSTFKGGIHPHKRKRFTREKPIEIYLPKGELVYPLSQQIGGLAIPVVKPGERVLEGQLIAEASGFISATRSPKSHRNPWTRRAGKTRISRTLPFPEASCISIRRRVPKYSAWTPPPMS